jgi:hypothetical protein
VRSLTAYFLATPAFAVADLVFGLSIRVAGLPVPSHRMMYYAAVFGLGLLSRARPATAPWLGMLESSVNLFLLLLGILLPIWSLADGTLPDHVTSVGLSGYATVNALLSGGALVLSFHRYQRAAAQTPGSERPWASS